MKPYWEQDNNKIFHGNALEVLKDMPDESVQMCVTSPPYWGLRDYGLPPMIWDGDSECQHVWGDALPSRGQSGWHTFEHKYHSPGSHKTTIGSKMKETQLSQNKGHGNFCQLCSAWRGCLGLEPTPELYIQHMVQIFREVRRVLRSDGTLWLNIGDSYASSHVHDVPWDGAHPKREGGSRIPPGLKPKDLCGIPWALAFALRSDGWWLRSAMPWIKRSAMPESVNDRPASALEYMFLFVKSPKYFFDMDAIRQGYIDVEIESSKRAISGFKDTPPGSGEHSSKGKPRNEFYKKSGRNFRNTDLFYESITPPHGVIFCGDEMVGLDVNPQAMKAAHFATFPERLIEPCILAGTSEKGCCVECGSPWKRVVEKNYKLLQKTNNPRNVLSDGKTGYSEMPRMNTESKTTGWKPTCDCCQICDHFNRLHGKDLKHQPYETEPCTVLDPFGGAMTTAIVAHKHNRKFIMIELSQTYIDEIGIPRIEKKTRQLKLWN